MDPKMDSSRSISRKRKLCDIMETSETDDNSKMARSDGEDQTKKQNHSEIEKRRRDKMNTYITELSSMVPMCNAMSRKLDKLTVLRMAVQHLKTLRGSINSYVEGLYKPSFLSDEELKRLILKAAEGFLFVVSCDRGRMLFVSESVSQVLNYSQNDLLGQSWFDILHPKDIAKVKEQLSSSDLSPKERLIDAKTMMPVKTDIQPTQVRLCPGARRSFFCRMRCKVSSSVKEEADTTTGMHRKKKSHSLDRRYCVIHCTGYLKSWAPANLTIDLENDADSDCNLSCLVAIGQVQHCLPNPSPKNGVELRSMEFTSRHAMDGKFLFVDQRAFLMLGYLPQELQGTSCYEYFHQDDIMQLAEFHRQVLQSQERLASPVYRFRRKIGNFAFLSSKWKTFRNPWTKELEYIISVNTLVPVLDSGIVESSNSARDEMYSSNSNSLDTVLSLLPSSVNMGETPRILGTKVGAGKIGRQIAEEVLERQRTNEIDLSSINPSTSDTYVIQQFPPTMLNTQKDRTNFPRSYLSKQDLPSTFENELIASSPSSNSASSQYALPVHNPVLMNDSVQIPSMDAVIGRDMLQASYQNNSNEGNDEAAMAVIMSLLEADAGLGGPVDFTGLPWPLP
ncbi:aryl hydrocarbon receptor nuclear translocator-like protein 1 [Trichonephila clavipes]|uniref:Aryl hydrocarbon receptor nuclear translocator-like protein 1 n=1 Tax=Trichonephila clavipes TaxID=2585209 RepID=A0A8X6SQS0_TRICX|nr:aryl hydrocarbon receptor nuclear translocator-like protein 1 [Trichonephila clavipes]